MKTHQKGNTIESGLSFIFVGFLTFWISPTNRGKAQRGESTCHLLNGPSNVFDVCSEKFFLSTHQRNLGVHRADDMCISDRVCADASNRWHVHKWFLGYVRLNRCHLPLVYIFERTICCFRFQAHLIYRSKGKETSRRGWLTDLDWANWALPTKNIHVRVCFGYHLHERSNCQPLCILLVHTAYTFCVDAIYLSVEKWHDCRGICIISYRWLHIEWFISNTF